MVPRLIVVSNRVAVPGAEAPRQAGGLAVAVNAALKQREGIWFGWSGRVAEDGATPQPTHAIAAASAVVNGANSGLPSMRWNPASILAPPAATARAIRLALAPGNSAAISSARWRISHRGRRVERQAAARAAKRRSKG